MNNGQDNKLLAGFVPKHLEIPERPVLYLFPMNILFASLQMNDGKALLGSAVYEPDLTSFEQKRDSLTLKYDNIYGDSWVTIKFIISKNYYVGNKYVRGEWMGAACGTDWHAFFSHLTSVGLVNAEPCKIEELPSD